MINIGDVAVNGVIDIPVNTFAATGESATVADLVAGDVFIYKGNSITQRSSSAGVSVIIDHDGHTGSHLITIDLSDNTDAGFYAAGNNYYIKVVGITVATKTLNPWIGMFSLVNRSPGLDFSTTQKASINAEVDTAISGLALQSTLTTVAGYLDTEIAAILADTNELQGDWANGGRLDLILDAAAVAGLDAAGVRSAIGLASANLDTQIAALPTDSDVTAACTSSLNSYDPPTKAELDAAVSGLALQSTLTTVAGYLDTEIAAILADTNELQGDWANGGRLDLILDAAAVAGLDAAGVRSAIGLASANLDTQLAALPTDADVNAACDTAISDAGLATASALSTVAGYIDTEVAAILADTNELQTDWANGGRLDLILDLIEDIVRNKMAVTNSNGNTILYADDNVTPLFTVTAALTNDGTTTTRKRLE